MRNRTDTEISNDKDGGISTRRHLFCVTLGSLFAIGCAFVLYLLVLTTDATVKAATPQQDGQSAVEAGQKMFESTCANSYCHAEDGGGAGPTNLQNRHFTVTQVTQIISDGVAGTSMPAWKTKYNADQIAKLAAYVLSLSSNSTGSPNGTPGAPEPAPAKASTDRAKLTDSYLPAVEAEVGGNAAQGRSIFFDDAEPANCGVCHTFQGKGGRVGPDLSKLANKSPDEILRSILQPDTVVDPRYATISITTRDGQQYIGVKRDETKDLIRMYDSSSMPPVSRSFLKSDVVKTETLKGSVMPKDYGEKYSKKDLLDLVTYIKAGGPNPNLMFPHTR
jgi:putative heme-binding domain-containing protein